MIDVLIAFAVVTAVGLLAGVALALISKFFGVEGDKRIKEIRECLPGVNCGACGYKGCDDYAEALAKGEAKPNLCVPGAKDTADALSELLGIEIEPPRDVVAFVHCNGHCDATETRAVYEGVSSCQAAAQLYGGPEACRFGCMGFGDCASACPVRAICIDDGIAHVNVDLCIGCGLCTETCPKHIISLVPRDVGTVVMCNSRDKGADARRACKNACIGCKRCEKTCPEGAISVKDDLAVIDYDKCTGCGACVAACPMGCLHSLVLINPKEPDGKINRPNE